METPSSRAPALSASRARYADVLATLDRRGEVWTADVHQDWLQGRTVFGGLQAALAVRAMRQLVEAGLPLRSVQTTFVAPVPAGPVELRAELLRTGRSATHAQCVLGHKGEAGCVVVAIFGASRASSFALEIPRPVIGVDPETLPDMPYVPGRTPSFVQHLQLRWARGTPPFTGYSEPSTAIYARVREPECTPEEALIALADSVPSPALSMLEEPAPASSLNWMLEFLGDPARLDLRAWSLIGTEVRAGTDGYLSQTSILWGPEGHAFTVSHQSVALFA